MQVGNHIAGREDIFHRGALFVIDDNAADIVAVGAERCDEIGAHIAAEHGVEHVEPQRLTALQMHGDAAVDGTQVNGRRCQRDADGGEAVARLCVDGRVGRQQGDAAAVGAHELRFRLGILDRAKQRRHPFVIGLPLRCQAQRARGALDELDAQPALKCCDATGVGAHERGLRLGILDGAVNGDILVRRLIGVANRAIAHARLFDRLAQSRHIGRFILQAGGEQHARRGYCAQADSDGEAVAAARQIRRCALDHLGAVSLGLPA